ncbi:MAG TPA: hypothetical protein ENN55_04705 [Firmicutes bacterium]|nr:hypothetical protein [Bacillota bacterium]
MNIDKKIEGFIMKVSKEMQHHTYGLNERYLHHWFSREFDVKYSYEDSKFHPEWPTYKKDRDNGSKEKFGLYNKKQGNLRVPNSPPKSAKQPYKNPRIC